ncbi:MAG: division/cell wall cluster transcriptional repressor MraZ [Chloroflexi bacterium]|nr:division/cell wall cluster transcriptional repressor MraZ [Chloroflexota bacterium]
MFIGATNNTIDEKGRLTLSAKWRSELASGVVITRGFDKCLFIFPQAKFETMAREIEEQGMALADVRSFARHLSAMAELAEPDKQGRIIIPQNLREFAGLNGEVVVIGVVNRLEVWNPKQYRETNEQVEANADMVAERYGQIMRKAALSPN